MEEKALCDPPAEQEQDGETESVQPIQASRKLLYAALSIIILVSTFFSSIGTTTPARRPSLPFVSTAPVSFEVPDQNMENLIKQPQLVVPVKEDDVSAKVDLSSSNHTDLHESLRTGEAVSQNERSLISWLKAPFKSEPMSHASGPTSPPTSPPVALPYPRITSRTGVTVFYAVGDIPYASSQLTYLEKQLTLLPADAEFLVHVGDIRSGSNPTCPLYDYTVVAEVLKKSPIPVFIVPGDNEWNDCYRPDRAWKNWASTFMFFENNWAHNLTVVRMPGRNETMAFVNKGTLFMGFNIPGGRVQDATEWQTRLTSQADWAINMIRYYDQVTNIGRVVMFSHADPQPEHNYFYAPIKEFVAGELQNRIPILSINGDGHEWELESSFFMPASSMLRLMVTGEAARPPHRITVTASGRNASFSKSFSCKY